MRNVLGSWGVGLRGLAMLLVTAIAACPGVVLAQTTIDVSDGLDQLTAAGVAIAAIGGAMLVLAGIAAAYKWARAAFF